MTRLLNWLAEDVTVTRATWILTNFALLCLFIPAAWDWIR